MTTERSGDRSAYRFESALQERVEHSKFETNQEVGPADVEEAELRAAEGITFESGEIEAAGDDPKLAAPESGTNHQDALPNCVDRTAGPDDAGQFPPESSGEDF